MVAAINQRQGPFNLVVTGEAESWLPALEQLIGSQWLVTYRARNDRELLEIVEARAADAAVLEESDLWRMDVLKVLRMIRRLDEALPVVVVAERPDRRWLENALRLTAFSVVAKPLELEELLRQIQKMMDRLGAMLRGEDVE